MDYKKVNAIEEADYWKPIVNFMDKDLTQSADLTLDKLYKVYYNEPQNCYYINDNAGCQSLIYICHKGEFLKEIIGD